MVGQGQGSLIHTDGRYLEMLNLFRILACLAVVSQHAFIWTGMTTNVVGTGFITMLHLSRNAFFFLTGLVVCYSQLVHPRSRTAFWRRRYVQLGVPYLAWTAIYLASSASSPSSASWDEVGRFLRHNLFLGYSQLYAAVGDLPVLLGIPVPLPVSTKARSSRRGDDRQPGLRHHPRIRSALSRHGSRPSPMSPIG